MPTSTVSGRHRHGTPRVQRPRPPSASLGRRGEGGCLSQENRSKKGRGSSLLRISITTRSEIQFFEDAVQISADRHRRTLPGVGSRIPLIPTGSSTGRCPFHSAPRVIEGVLSVPFYERGGNCHARQGPVNRKPGEIREVDPRPGRQTAVSRRRSRPHSRKQANAIPRSCTGVDPQGTSGKRRRLRTAFNRTASGRSVTQRHPESWKRSPHAGLVGSLSPLKPKARATLSWRESMSIRRIYSRHGRCQFTPCSSALRADRLTEIPSDGPNWPFPPRLPA